MLADFFQEADQKYQISWSFSERLQAGRLPAMRTEEVTGDEATTSWRMKLRDVHQ
jgi:hypothetical protein